MCLGGGQPAEDEISGQHMRPLRPAAAGWQQAGGRLATGFRRRAPAVGLAQLRVAELGWAEPGWAGVIAACLPGPSMTGG